MEEEKQVVNEAPKKSDEGFLKRYDTVFAFLGLEVIALMLFGLGGATGQTIVKVLSVALGLLAYPFVKAEYGKETIKKNAIRLIPLWVFFLVIGFSAFWVDVYSSTFSAIVLNLMEALGLFGMFLLGFTLKCIKALKRDIILLVILGSLALYVLVVGIYTFARYGFFYQSFYAGRVYYYDGVLFPSIAKRRSSMVLPSWKPVLISAYCPRFYSLLPGLVYSRFIRRKTPSAS